MKINKILIILFICFSITTKASKINMYGDMNKDELYGGIDYDLNLKKGYILNLGGTIINNKEEDYLITQFLPHIYINKPFVINKSQTINLGLKTSLGYLAKSDHKFKNIISSGVANQYLNVELLDDNSQINLKFKLFNFIFGKNSSKKLESESFNFEYSYKF